ncbi:MAG: HNH endonuclease [Pseudobdellovibrionaceae bacterium]|nr:MAG: HNH endonuclease [Pseudobdellovibrionaceae bacterium]
MLKVFLDSEKLHLLKSRLNVACEQELLQLLVEEKLKATEPDTTTKLNDRANPSRRARSISPGKRAIVIKNAQHQCENCGSKYSLQIDHRVSVALGGSNHIENLRLLCRSCNQRAAIEQLGLKMMDKYINKQPPSEKV